MLEEIEERIEQYKMETAEWKEKKSTAEKSAKGANFYPLSRPCPLLIYTLAIEAQLKEIRAFTKEFNAHLDALKNGEAFTPTLTGKGAKSESKTANGKKRKRGGKDSSKNGSSKRRKGDAFEDDDDMLGSEDDDLESDIQSDSGSDTDKDEESDDNDEDEEGSQSGHNSEGESENTEEQTETVDSLKKKTADAKGAIKLGRERLSEVRQQKKEAIDGLAGLKKRETKVQREKNAFCSLKRSEVRHLESFCYSMLIIRSSSPAMCSRRISVSV